MKGPIAPPIASGALIESACKQSGSGRNSPPKDPSLRPTNYLTAARLERLERELSPTDWAVLSFVSSVRLVTSAQLMRRFWAPRAADASRARAGREALRRLHDVGVLGRLPRMVGGTRAGSDGYVYAVGHAGRRLLARRGLDIRRYGTPGDRFVAHTLAVAEAVTRLHEGHDQGQLELIEVQTEPRCHRSYLTGFGGSATLKPDLLVRLGVGAYEDRLFVEVDQATEASGTITGKAAAYLQHFRSGTEQSGSGVYPGVLWLAPDERRVEQLRGILARQRGGMAQMHDIALQHDLVSHLTGEAGS